MYGHFSGINRKVQLKYQVVANFCLPNSTLLSCSPRAALEARPAKKRFAAIPPSCLFSSGAGSSPPPAGCRPRSSAKCSGACTREARVSLTYRLLCPSCCFYAPPTFILSVFNLPHLPFESFWPFSDLLIGGVPASEVPMDRNSRATSLPNGRLPSAPGNTNCPV